MKRLLLSLGLAAGLLAFSPGLPAQDNPNPEPSGQVTKLDGTKIFGVVEITDDYTIRVRSDSGIQNLPIALLGENDFQKYGLRKDRSQDGRLWSERQNALEEEKETHPKNATAIEFRLAELAPLQPVIAAYESLNPPKPANSGPTAPASSSSPSAEKSPTLHMFTGPGSLNIPSVPFASGAADTVLSPATSAASSAAGLAPPGLTPP